MGTLRAWRAFITTIALGTALASHPARALEGYFQHGYGARHQALAGAGVADGRDATIAIINPAGLVHARRRRDRRGLRVVQPDPRDGRLGAARPHADGRERQQHPAVLRA
ncbi:MAG: hypothetical protein WDN31_08700 [Hyphomicrobium sp.]